MLKYLAAHCFIAFSCLLFSLHVQALDDERTVVLNNITSEYKLTHHISYYEDKNADLDIDHVLRNKQIQWSNHPDSSPNFGLTQSVYWLKFDVHNDIAHAKWFLVIGYPLLDNVDVYIKSHDDDNPHVLKRLITTGDQYVFDNRQLDHRLLINDLELIRGETATVYLRIQSDSPIQVPISIWDKENFLISDQKDIMMQGFYFGGMIVMALFNLLILFIIRDPNYAYYVCFVSSHVIFQLAIHGIGYQYFWPNSVGFQQISSVFGLYLSMAFAALFFNSFLNLKKHRPILSKVTIYYAILLFLGALLVFILPYAWSLSFSMVSVAMLALFSLAVSIPLAINGMVEARFYLISWGAMIAGGIILALSKAGILPQNSFTDNGLQVGTIIEVVLLSLAMANRINVERRRRYHAQGTALRIQKEANETLERKVQERTKELEALNEKLNKISRTDALTGVLNRRAFDQLYEKELEYSKEHGTMLSILVVDIDHFKSINDNYGHLCGDECLKSVGQLMLNYVSGFQHHVTRYGGEEFVIAMRDANEADAFEQAERLRKAIESHVFTFENHELSCTVSIGVACGKPSDSEEMNLFCDADKALYSAKENGRNQVQLSASAIT